jgi:hypothetical protein
MTARGRTAGAAAERSLAHDTSRHTVARRSHRVRRTSPHALRRGPALAPYPKERPPTPAGAARRNSLVAASLADSDRDRTLAHRVVATISSVPGSGSGISRVSRASSTSSIAVLGSVTLSYDAAALHGHGPAARRGTSRTQSRRSVVGSPSPCAPELSTLPSVGVGASARRRTRGGQCAPPGAVCAPRSESTERSYAPRGWGTTAT